MRYAIGIDLGGTNIAAGIVTEDYKLLEKGSVPTKAQRPWQEVAADMARLAMELVEKAGLSRADCAGIGVGSPGICNGDTGEVVYSNNLYWDDVPLCPTLTRLTGLPCRLKKQGCRGLSSPGAATGSIQCPLPLRAPYTTHACMLPASAQPEPPCVGIVHHTQTKTAPAKGCMARRGCAAAGHEKLRGSRAGYAPQRFMR